MTLNVSRGLGALVRGADRGSARDTVPRSVRPRGRGRLVAEGLELADEVARLAVLVEVLVVEVGAEVVVAGGGAGEEIPGDHVDGAGDGDEGPLLAAATDETPIALAQAGVGLGRAGGGLAEHALEVAVALAGFARSAPWPGLDGAGRQLGPRHQVRRGGELGHVQADLGDGDLGGVYTDPGDLIEAGNGRQGYNGRVAVAVAAIGGLGGGGLGRGDLGYQLADADGERVDLSSRPLSDPQTCSTGLRS
jgi:hypothetical protein